MVFAGRSKARVGFTIGGVQKAGTTALWQFLKMHPSIRFGVRKELHFFDDDRRDWARPSYRELHRAFGFFAPFAGVSQGAVLGDATPVYIYWPPSLDRIKAYNPQMKFLVSLRNPIDRAYSHWRMEKIRGAETLPFAEAIREGRKRIAQAPLLAPERRIYSYVERGFYAAQLDRLFARFPAHQVLIVRMEDLRGHHQAVLDRVTDFLGVPRFADYPPAEIVFSFENQDATPINAQDRAYLQALYADDLARLANQYGVEMW